MDLIPTIFTGALVVLTIVLTVVGVYMVLVLLELRKTIKRVNDVLESADEKISALTAPIHKLGQMAVGLGTGMKVFEAFVGWLQRSRDGKARTSKHD